MSSHTLLDMWLLIHAGIKLNNVSKKKAPGFWFIIALGLENTDGRGTYSQQTSVA